MQTISCPTCGTPLRASDGYCAHCGEDANMSAITQRLTNGHDTPATGVSRVSLDTELLERIEVSPTIKLARKVSRPPDEAPPEPAESELTLKLTRRPDLKRVQVPPELAES